MSDEGTGAQQQPTDEDAQVAMDTGIRDQRLVVSGWFASHADTGTRGPHVHLGTGDGGDPVLRTSQIPELVDALNLVGGRIDRMWETDGAEYRDPVPVRRPSRRLGHHRCTSRGRLSRANLFAMTRSGSDARTRMLDDLRSEE
jgi:hypothetical protein